MQTLRKKSSPLKYKEITRFLGEGVTFKAKLIGILEVSEARGDRMCQEALADLKMAIRAAGEHKQRININIAIDGLRLRDEKTGDSLYHHPVHKISFIAQDMTDSRAFGYIFGSPDTGHRFFGIKTDKAASQLVIAMRDLFQVVFALKKKEIELAKQNLDKSCRYPPTSPLFSETGSTSKLQSTTENSKTSNDPKVGATALETKGSGATAVADLVDLELELNSLQQGLNQMERITPSEPFPSKDDPFGDSFISYPKPFLPPPPSSGKERSSRTSESGSLFSPKTPHTGASLDATNTDTSLFSSKNSSKKEFSFSRDFSSHEESGSGDWFTPNSFEESAASDSISKDERHELAKKEILSQFDVFTELDPLGTGRSKPYIDKKHFFQELKNPPKKVLNDLVNSNAISTQDQTLFNTGFSSQLTSKSNNNTGAVFSNDPFGEDPFVTEDPFAESEFPQDPFESEFNEYKIKDQSLNNLDKFRYDSKKLDNLQAMLTSTLSKSPKHSNSLSTSPRNIQYSSFSSTIEDKKINKMSELHENPSLDMSSESECAPEPPPRPATASMQIKPPPLPPKKYSEMITKPPPRPPHTEDPIYDYMDNYKTAPSSLEYTRNIEKSPPIPVPLRKSKFDTDFSIAPERPKKQFNLQSSEEDYLTPIDYSKIQSMDENRYSDSKKTGLALLHPPQRNTKKQPQTTVASTVASFLESKPNITTSISSDRSSLEGLDITLSQLTLSNLNELAIRLKIPPSTLSNMTLVQLTCYLSNFIKTQNSSQIQENEPEIHTKEEAPTTEPETTFQADFAANFNELNNSTGEPADNYDRYAVFRELMKEDIKQTKIDTEPEELRQEQEANANKVNFKPLAESKANTSATDRYAALREIVDIDLKQNNTIQENGEENKEIETDENTDDQLVNDDKETNNVEIENQLNKEETDKDLANDIINFNNEEETKSTTPLKSPKSPLKSAIKSPLPNIIHEIVQNNTRLTSGSLSDVVSGSSPEVDNTGSNSEKKLNDATGESWAIFDQSHVPVETREKEKQQSEEGVSPWSSDSKEFGNGSPPDYRKGESSGRVDQWIKKKREQQGWWDTAAEPEEPYYPPNRRSTDSYDEEYYDSYDRPRRRRQGNWTHQGGAGGHSSSSRDVSPWEEEPRRKELREPRDGRESRPSGWSRRHPRQPSFDRHSRESRDSRERPIDSWDEEEDDYEYEDDKETRFHWAERHSSRESERDRHSTGDRHSSTDRLSVTGDRHSLTGDRHTVTGDRHSVTGDRHIGTGDRHIGTGDRHSVTGDRHSVTGDRHSVTGDRHSVTGDRHSITGDRHSVTGDRHSVTGDRHSVTGDRHSSGSRDRDTDRDTDRWVAEGWSEERRSRYRGDRWCLPDYELSDHDKNVRYGRYSNPDAPQSGKYRTRHEERYYSRESQESPWEDEYGNELSDSHSPHYAPSRRQNWKQRPSSATEMDRKTGDIKPRHYLGTGGSDGERDRRYKPNSRRSRSRDSQYSEPVHRHKLDQPAPLRNPHRNKSHYSKVPADLELPEPKKPTEKPEKLIDSNKKASTLSRSKKSKESPKTEENMVSTFPRKSSSRNKLLFENDFVTTESKVNFENDFETSEAESPSSVTRQVRISPHPPHMFEKGMSLESKEIPRDAKPTKSSFKESKVSPRYSAKLSSSMFEDDFSPSEKSEMADNISSIKEEEDSFGTNDLQHTTTTNTSSKRILSKNRLSNSMRTDLKKSESVNIFARENDPFDDDFFSGNIMGGNGNTSRNTDIRWTEDFEEFDAGDRE